MSRRIDGDDPFEDEEYRRRVEQERRDRELEKAPPRDCCPVHTGTPEPCPECESKIAAGL